MNKFWRNNSLSIVLFSIFIVTLIGMSIVGWRSAQNDASDHNQPATSYSSYITSGDFVEGVFENWESEFLQMFALVYLTVWLRQKGADDSKPIRGKTPEDTSSRLSLLRSTDWQARRKAIQHTLYSHSLSITRQYFYRILSIACGWWCSHDERGGSNAWKLAAFFNAWVHNHVTVLV